MKEAEFTKSILSQKNKEIVSSNEEKDKKIEVLETQNKYFQELLLNAQKTIKDMNKIPEIQSAQAFEERKSFPICKRI